MKQKFCNILAIVAVVLFSAVFQTSCKKDAPMYTIKFDSKGGSAVVEQKVKQGGKVQEPPPPNRANSDFNGWATADNETSPLWNFATGTVTENITLYARWTAHVQCEICGEWNCETAHEQCPVCDEWDCEKEHMQCEICDEWDCEAAHKQCPVCEEWDCEKEHVQCEICGEWDCEIDHSSVIINDKNATEIQAEIQASLSNGDFSAVTVTGSASVGNAGITLVIPADKTVNWNADLTGEKSGNDGLIVLDESGGGNLVITGSIINTGGTTIVAHAGDVTVSGGTVRNTNNSGSAIHVFKTEQTVTIDNGGVVRNIGSSGNWTAVIAPWIGIGLEQTLNFVNGVIFSHVNPYSNLRAYMGSNSITIRWSSQDTPKVYQHGTDTDLTSTPANQATWCSEAQGIVNTRNEIMIQIDGVTVEE